MNYEITIYISSIPSNQVPHHNELSFFFKMSSMIVDLATSVYYPWFVLLFCI